MSSDPYRKLVRLVARAFYGGEVPPHTGPRSVAEKIDCRGGEAVILLDALTRRQWVKEEDLAKSLKLHPKQLRRTLRALEEDQLVVREHRREYAPPKPGSAVTPGQGPGAGPSSSSAGATQPIGAPAGLGGSVPGHVADKAVTDGSGRIIRQAVHQFCYCRINYGRFVDVVRFKLGRMRQRLVDDLDENNTCQEYVCPRAGCGRRYTALDAPRLIDPRDLLFHCEECQSELELKQGEVELGEAVEGAATDAASALARQRQRKAVLRDLLRRMDSQLKPIMDQLERTKSIAPPEFESLAEFCLRMARSRASAARANNHDDADADAAHGGDGYHGAHHHGGYGSALPYFGDTQFEVDIDMGNGLGVGADGGAAAAAAAADTPAPKELPPWMIREGMVLPSGAVAGSSHDPAGRATGANGDAAAGRPPPPATQPLATTTMTVKAEVKSEVKQEEPADDAQSLQERYQAEYVKAYYEAMLAAAAAQQAAVAAQADVDSTLASATQEGTEGATTVTTVTITQKTEVLVTTVAKNNDEERPDRNEVVVKEEAAEVPAEEGEEEGIEWDDVGQGGAIVMGGDGDVMDDVEWEEAAPAGDAGGASSGVGVATMGGLDVPGGAVPGEGLPGGGDADGPDDAEWEDA